MASPQKGSPHCVRLAPARWRFYDRARRRGFPRQHRRVSTMKRRGLLMAAAGVCLVVGSTATLLLAKPGIVRTKEGQVYNGDVVDIAANDYVTVTVHGITTRIDRADVSEITDGQGL